MAIVETIHSAVLVAELATIRGDPASGVKVLRLQLQAVAVAGFARIREDSASDTEALRPPLQRKNSLPGGGDPHTKLHRLWLLQLRPDQVHDSQS